MQTCNGVYRVLYIIHELSKIPAKSVNHQKSTRVNFSYFRFHKYFSETISYTVISPDTYNLEGETDRQRAREPEIGGGGGDN